MRVEFCTSADVFLVVVRIGVGVLASLRNRTQKQQITVVNQTPPPPPPNTNDRRRGSTDIGGIVVVDGVVRAAALRRTAVGRRRPIIIVVIDELAAYRVVVDVDAATQRDLAQSSIEFRQRESETEHRDRRK
jgi:hypothetical protein